MPRFAIQIERVIREKDIQYIEAETQAEAFQKAHDAYCNGATESNPHSYDWEGCGDVEEIEFQSLDDGGEVIARAAWHEAEEGHESLN